MRRLVLRLTIALVVILWASSALAYYGTVEFLDGRILNGKIEVIGELDQIGFFVPAENAYIMVPLVEVKRMEFNWNVSPNADQPYYLRNKGDIRVYMINGEVIEGAYFGSASGIRQLKVVLDDMREAFVFLNDNKLNRSSAMRSINFETIHVPADDGKVIVSGKSGKITPIHYRVSVDVADLHETPKGPSRAKVHYGVGLTYLEKNGEWVRVRTVGDVEVEGWVRLNWVSRAQQ